MEIRVLSSLSLTTNDNKRLTSLLCWNAEPAKSAIATVVTAAINDPSYTEDSQVNIDWSTIKLLLLKRFNLAVKISRQFNWLLYRFGPHLQNYSLDKLSEHDWSYLKIVTQTHYDDSVVDCYLTATRSQFEQELLDKLMTDRQSQQSVNHTTVAELVETYIIPLLLKPLDWLITS